MNTIANLLPALRPDIIPVAGSRADLALDKAASLLERSGLSRGEILLVTDSASSRDAAKARKLRDRGILTSVLAAGTAEGAPIPSGGGFISDRSGNVVIARLDRSALRSLAEAGGGRYTELAASDSADSLWLDQEGSEFARRDDALGERWKDMGPWLVLLLLPLALSGFRKGLFFLMPLFLAGGLVTPGEAMAGWWDDLWQRKDQQAYRALSEQDAAKAAALARDPSLSGEAWFRSGEYANAKEAWSRAESADAHYNRGNALAHLGEYDAAIAAYDRALSLDPGMQDAEINRELVEKMKEQQEQQQQEGDQGDSQESESSSEQQQGEQGQEGDEQQGEQEGEDAQAMEQWLRRIPDDPGGLLRRKFRNQHQRRGAPEDETESW